MEESGRVAAEEEYFKLAKREEQRRRAVGSQQRRSISNWPSGKRKAGSQLRSWRTGRRRQLNLSRRPPVMLLSTSSPPALWIRTKVTLRWNQKPGLKLRYMICWRLQG